MMDEKEKRQRQNQAQKGYIERMGREEYNRRKREYMKEYRKKPENKKKMNAYHAEYRKRTQCQKRYNAAHPEWRERRLEKGRKRDAEARREVIRRYGGKCEICGISQIEYLTLDHSFDDGAEHRKAVHRKIYRDIVKNGFPKDKGYRVLCWNHNIGRYHGADIEAEKGAIKE